LFQDRRTGPLHYRRAIPLRRHSNIQIRIETPFSILFLYNVYTTNNISILYMPTLFSTLLTQCILFGIFVNNVFVDSICSTPALANILCLKLVLCVLLFRVMCPPVSIV